MKKIFIVTGRTGAGKTALCNRLSDYFNCPCIAFMGVGREIANSNGYNRIRDYYLEIGLEQFKEAMSKHFSIIIDEKMNSNENIVIDGLYIYEVFNTLNTKYDCRIINIDANELIRYKRISEKLSITIEQAQKENKEKEELKDEVGIDELIKKADITIDGNKSKDEVFKIAKQYIEKLY